MQLLTIVVSFKTLKMRVYQKHPIECVCDKFAIVLPANARDEIIFETRWIPDISWSFFFNRVEVNRSFHVETSSGVPGFLLTCLRCRGRLELVLGYVRLRRVQHFSKFWWRCETCVYTDLRLSIMAVAILWLWIITL